MTDKVKKVKRPKGEAPTPNPKAEAAALDSMGGKMPKDKSKNRREKGDRPVPNADAEAKAADKAESHGEPVWVVPEGVEIPSLRGLLKAGDDVIPRYLRGGNAVLVELASKGLLVRKNDDRN